MKLLPALFLCLTLLLPAPTLADPAYSSRPLSPADCAVMQLYLQHKGHRVQVEAGRLVIEGNKVRAHLQCRSGELAFEWSYPLGNLERQEALGK